MAPAPHARRLPSFRTSLSLAPLPRPVGKAESDEVEILSPFASKNTQTLAPPPPYPCKKYVKEPMQAIRHIRAAREVRYLGKLHHRPASSLARALQKRPNACVKGWVTCIRPCGRE